MILDESAIANGVDAISLVADPAIKANWVALSAEEVKTAEPYEVKFSVVDGEKRIVLGAVLIPDKPILRTDKTGKPYHIFFGSDTIRKTSELFLKRGYQNSATLEHSVKLQGTTVVESWIVDDPNMDKSKLYNLGATAGTWVVGMKVDNDEVWNDYVKTQKVKGFSIEGWFRIGDMP